MGSGTVLTEGTAVCQWLTARTSILDLEQPHLIQHIMYLLCKGGKSYNEKREREKKKERKATPEQRHLENPGRELRVLCSLSYSNLF